MATILNRHSKEVIKLRRPRNVNYLALTTRGFYFSKPLALDAGMRSDKYIHFINDGDYWAFIVNDDNAGFRISNCNGNHILCSMSISRLFIKGTNRKIGDRFMVIKTSSELNGSPIFEIYTKESLQVKIDREKRLREQRRKILQIKATKG